jgi:hypothetical protein
MSDHDCQLDKDGLCGICEYRIHRAELALSDEGDDLSAEELGWYRDE